MYAQNLEKIARDSVGSVHDFPDLSGARVAAVACGVCCLRRSEPTPMTSPVDTYLDSLSDPWSRDIAETVITMIRGSGGLDEFIKWGHPYFSSNGHATVKIFTAHDWINVFFYQGAELHDPTGLLGPEGRSNMRRVQIFRDQAVPDGVRDLIRQAIVIAERNGQARPS